MSARFSGIHTHNELLSATMWVCQAIYDRANVAVRTDNGWLRPARICRPLRLGLGVTAKGCLSIRPRRSRSSAKRHRVTSNRLPSAVQRSACNVIRVLAMPLAARYIQYTVL